MLKVLVILFLFIILFLVNLDSIEDKCTFLRIFKRNINWLEHIVEIYSPLFFAVIIIGVIIWSVFKLSLSVKSISFAGFEISLKDTDKTVKNNIKNYLNTKRSLFYIKPEYDNICEVFDSYHNVYDFLRSQLLQYEDKNKTSSLFYLEIQVMLKELNEFLTVHQSNYRRWFAFSEKKNENLFCTLGELQKEYPKFDILMNDFTKINEAMCKHAEVFGIDMLDWEYEKTHDNNEGNENENDIK